jgi:hypothetical protein
MAATLSEVRSQAYSLLNASSVYGTLNSDLYVQGEVDESALERDLRVCAAILETPDATHLTAFSAPTVAGVATGTILLDHVGPIFNVKRTRTDASVVLAEPQPYPNVMRWQRNDSALYATANLKERVYSVAHNQIHFVGGGSISYQYRALSKLASLQAPVEYQHLIVAGVLADLYGKEAQSETLAQHYDKQFDAGIERIRQRLPPLPLEVAA